MVMTRRILLRWKVYFCCVALARFGRGKQVKMADGGEKASLGKFVRNQAKYGTTTQSSSSSTNPVSSDTFLKHFVKPHDTLQGIALKHGVTVSLDLVSFWHLSLTVSVSQLSLSQSAVIWHFTCSLPTQWLWLWTWHFQVQCHQVTLHWQVRVPMFIVRLDLNLSKHTKKVFTWMH